MEAFGGVVRLVAGLALWERVVLAISVVGSSVVLCDFVFRPRRLDLRGKHVVVTGGSQGIGKCVATKCAVRGAHVTIVARKPAGLQAAQAEIQQAVAAAKGTARVEVCAVDVSADAKKVDQAMQSVRNKMDLPIDVLVNCAGTSIPGTFEDVAPETFEKLMRVNYLGSVFPTRAVVPEMKRRKQGGRILFVSSQAGQCGVFGFSAYSPTKFAVVGLAQVLAMELKPHNVTVGVSFPPDTDTPGFAEENKCKPEECRLISETSGLFKPEDVAEDIVVKGIIGGHFAVYSGLDGWMLANLTSGFGPATSFLDTLVQASGALSLLRVIAVAYLFYFNSIVTACQQKRDAAKDKAD